MSALRDPEVSASSVDSAPVMMQGCSTPRFVSVHESEWFAHEPVLLRLRPDHRPKRLGVVSGATCDTRISPQGVAHLLLQGGSKHQCAYSLRRETSSGTCRLGQQQCGHHRHFPWAQLHTIRPEQHLTPSTTSSFAARTKPSLSSA